MTNVVSFKAPHVNLAELFHAGLKMYRSGGLPRGDPTGWLAVDKHYSVAMGQWTIVTGIPSQCVVSDGTNPQLPVLGHAAEEVQSPEHSEGP